MILILVKVLLVLVGISPFVLIGLIVYRTVQWFRLKWQVEDATIAAMNEIEDNFNATVDELKRLRR